MKRRYDLKESDYRTVGYVCMPTNEFVYNKTIDYARKAYTVVEKNMCLPLVPYLNCMVVTDGINDTDKFYESWKKLIEISDVVFVFDYLNPTEQMQKEINYAKYLGKKIHNERVGEE